MTGSSYNQLLTSCNRLFTFIIQYKLATNTCSCIKEVIPARRRVGETPPRIMSGCPNAKLKAGGMKKQIND